MTRKEKAEAVVTAMHDGAKAWLVTKSGARIFLGDVPDTLPGGVLNLTVDGPIADPEFVEIARPLCTWSLVFDLEGPVPAVRLGDTLTVQIPMLSEDGFAVSWSDAFVTIT